MGQQLSPFPFLFLLAAAMLGASPVALAAAQRTFVPSYGSPANTSFNCSIAKPCRAFTEALGVTNSGGEVVVLDSAAHGATTITPSVSLVAPAGIYAGITVSTPLCATRAERASSSLPPTRQPCSIACAASTI